MILPSLEAILFSSAKPVSRATLLQALDLSEETLREAVEALKARFNTEDSGIHIIDADGKLQMVTNPNQSEFLRSVLKQEMSEELTRPSLETLTIIAYRGPLTKPEIEQIRGVNCSLILRNLLMRGLIEEQDNIQKLQPEYSVSSAFLRHMGVHTVSELPAYTQYHDDEKITRMLEELSTASPESL